MVTEKNIINGVKLRKTLNIIISNVFLSVIGTIGLQILHFFKYI